MNFSTSTHRSRWIFTSRRLLQLRQLLNKGATGVEPWSTSEASQGAAGGKEGSEPPPVSVDEEQLLLRFYESKVSGLCGELHLPRKVEHAALLYFKRYYLSHSCISSDPLRILITCIYLAAKVEESYVSAERLCATVKLEPSIALRAEVPVLQGLHFDLVVHLPHRALMGLLQDILDLRKSGQVEVLGPELAGAKEEALNIVRSKSLGSLDVLMRTDAPLLHPPASLALAALRSGLKHQGLGLGSYLHRLVQQGMQAGGGAGAQQAAEAALLEGLDAMDKLAVAGLQTISQQEVADIDRRIRLWRAKSSTQDNAGDAQGDAAAKAAKREAKLKARKERAASEEAAKG